MAGKRNKYQRSRCHFSTSHAVQGTLLRLGMHARASEVVEALAEYGIVVSEGLVHRVKLEMVQQTSQVQRQLAAMPRPKSVVRLPPKVPGGRGHRNNR